MIVVRRRCTPRFLTESGRTLENPHLGTVVDLEATRPEWQVCRKIPWNKALTLGSALPCSACLLPHTASFPLRYDFYLISQVARQGTVNPTYYNVIYDDNGLKPDHMQRLTFKLCHLYYNWPVSDRCGLRCRLVLEVATQELAPDALLYPQPWHQVCRDPID